MKFMTPEKYTKTQEGHFVINTNAVNQFVEIYGSLDCKDKVLDFGSGTGETTAAMAQVRNDSKDIHSTGSMCAYKIRGRSLSILLI